MKEIFTKIKNFLGKNKMHSNIIMLKNDPILPSDEQVDSFHFQEISSFGFEGRFVVKLAFKKRKIRIRQR